MRIFHGMNFISSFHYSSPISNAHHNHVLCYTTLSYHSLLRYTGNVTAPYIWKGSDNNVRKNCHQRILGSKDLKRRKGKIINMPWGENVGFILIRLFWFKNIFFYYSLCFLICSYYHARVILYGGIINRWWNNIYSVK